MSAATEMSRLDSIPTEQLEKLLGTEGLPAVKAKDNGKVLMVVDGEWAVVSLPVELPVVTADDNGAVLTVVEGAWAAVAPETTPGG